MLRVAKIRCGDGGRIRCDEKNREKFCDVNSAGRGDRGLVKVGISGKKIGSKFGGFAIKPDFYQKFPGRGAYVCCDENCFKILKKKHCLDKIFRCFVDDEVYEALEHVIKFKEV